MSSLLSHSACYNWPLRHGVFAAAAVLGWAGGRDRKSAASAFDAVPLISPGWRGGGAALAMPAAEREGRLAPASPGAVRRLSRSLSLAARAELTNRRARE